MPVLQSNTCLNANILNFEYLTIRSIQGFNCDLKKTKSNTDHIVIRITY
jgi:hypothetical protein